MWMLTRLRRRQTNPRRWEAGCWAPPAAVAVLPAAVAAAATALVSAARRAVPLCSAEFPHLNLTSYRSPAARPCGAKTGQNPMLRSISSCELSVFLQSQTMEALAQVTINRRKVV